MKVHSVAEYLPGYLDGVNIRRNNRIVDYMVEEVHNTVEYLCTLWSPVRPILVERVQEAFDGTAVLYVHVHVDSPLKEIQLKDIFPPQTIHYSEDELVMDVTIPVQQTDEYPIMMKGVTVQVETYDGLTYEKAYPENDIHEENIADHDMVLDNLGLLLGIPRHIFRPVMSQEELNYNNCYPEYWAKPSAPHGYWTEDDYYYSQRIQHFMRYFREKDRLQLMGEVLYVDNDFRLYNMKNRRTSLYMSIESMVGSMMICCCNGMKYSNIDYTNQNTILEKYVPVTRPFMFIQRALVELDVDCTVTGTILEIEGEIFVYPEGYEGFEEKLQNAPILIYVDNVIINKVYSTTNGTFFRSIDLSNLELGTIHTCTIIYESEYECVPSDDQKEGCSFEFTIRNQTGINIIVPPNIISEYGSDIEILGQLEDSYNNGLGNATVKLKHGDTVLDTVTTLHNGTFMFTYLLNDWAYDGTVFSIVYDGDEDYTQSSANFIIHLKHNTIINVGDVTGYTDDIVDIAVDVVDETNNPVLEGNIDVVVEPILQPYTVYEGTVHSDEKGFECDDITFAHPMGTDNNLSYTNNSKVLFWAVPTDDLEEIIEDIDSNNGKIGLRHTVDLNGENYNMIDYGDITVFISNAPNNQYLRLNGTVITENSGNSHTWTLYRNSLGTGTEEPVLKTLRGRASQISQITYCLASVDADVYQTILESANTLDQYGYGGAGNITLPCSSTVAGSEFSLYDGKYFIYTKGNYQFTPTYIEFEVDDVTTHEYKKLYGDSALEMIERIESHPEESLFLDLADVTNNQTDKFYLRMSHPVGSERDDCLDELVIEITDENGDVYDNISGGFDYQNNVLNLQLAGEIGTTISFDGIDFEGVSATYNGGIINLSCDYNGFDSLISNGKLTLKGTINLQGIYKTGYRLTVPYEEIPVPITTYTYSEEEFNAQPEIGYETPCALYLGDCCEVVISQNVRFDEDYDYLLHFNSINKYTRFGVKDSEGTSHTQRLVNMGVNGGYETHEGIHENIRLFVDQNNLYAEYEGYVGLILSGVGNSEYNFTFYEGSSKMGDIWNNTELVYIRKVRAGNRYRVISDIGVGGIPFSSDSSLIKTAPVNITGEGYLECPENVWRTYYIPDTSVDWTARIKVRIDTTQNYYGHIVYYNTNGPANIHLEKNNSRIYGDTNVLNQPNITSDTGQQEIVIKQENGIITLSYPNSNGGWTSNTFTRPEPSNDRIAIRSLNTNSFYIESFKFTEIIPVGGGNRSMKYLDITDYSVSRDTATSEGTTGSDYQLPFVTDEGNMNLGLRYDFILSEPLDVSGNYTYKVTVYTWNKWIRFGCVSQSGRTYATPYDLGITEIPSDPYTYTLYREGNNFYAELDGIRKPIINNISTSKEYHLYLYNISANVETELISVQKIRTDETVTGTNRRTYLPVSSLDNWIIDRYSATNENKLEEASVEPKMTENGLMLGYRYDCIYEKVLDMTGGHEYYITFTYRNRYTRIGLRRIQNNAIKQNHHTVLQYNEIIPNSPITATYRLFVENGNIKLQSNNNTATLVNGNTATDYRLYLYGLFTEGNEECISIIEEEV